MRRWSIIGLPVFCTICAIAIGALWSQSQSRWHEISLVRGQRYFVLSAGSRIRLGGETRRINSLASAQLVTYSFSPNWTFFITHGALAADAALPIFGGSQIGRASVTQGHIEDFTQHIVYFPHWLAIAGLCCVPLYSGAMRIRRRG